MQEFLSDPDTCIGVHCVTGLGRAPVLVATALIELGMKYEVRPLSTFHVELSSELVLYVLYLVKLYTPGQFNVQSELVTFETVSWNRDTS